MAALEALGKTKELEKCQFNSIVSHSGVWISNKALADEKPSFMICQKSITLGVLSNSSLLLSTSRKLTLIRYVQHRFGVMTYNKTNIDANAIE